MIVVVTVVAALAAWVMHVVGWQAFEQVVTIPAAGLIAMCAIGVMGRLAPRVRGRLIEMVPPRLPRPAALVWTTGALELLGAIGLLLEPTRLPAAVGLAFLLLCVFPANVREAHLRGDPDGTSRVRILRRGGVQTLFLALCVWVVIADAM